MSPTRLHPLSLLSGCALALLVFVALGQKDPTPTTSFEYRVVDDVDAKELAKLAGEGWDYAGYLGTGVKGSGNDETLWRRPAK
jgi:hypothetical protein